MKLILGKLNKDQIINYWRCDGMYPNIGDYAIVENINDYDLVKIIGMVETDIKYEKFLTPNGVSKKVIKTISRDSIRGD